MHGNTSLAICKCHSCLRAVQDYFVAPISRSSICRNFCARWVLKLAGAQLGIVLEVTLDARLIERLKPLIVGLITCAYTQVSGWVETEIVLKLLRLFLQAGEGNTFKTAKLWGEEIVPNKLGADD
eukprot:1654533-Amphidinium_carterae.2